MRLVDCEKNRLRCGAAAWLGGALLLFGSSACSSEDPPDGPNGSAAASAMTGGSPASGAGGMVATGGKPATSSGGTGVAGVTAVAGRGGAGGMPMATGGTSGMPVGGKGGPMAANTDWTLMGYDLGSTYNNVAETVLTKENAATLEEAWTADMGGSVYSAPLQVGDTIYVAGPNDVRALDGAGKMLWTNPTTSTASLAYADGMIFVNNDAAEIVAINAETGIEIWKKKPGPADGNSSPIVAGDLVLIGGSNGNMELSGGGTFRGYLAALDRMGGAMKWLTYTVPEDARGASIWSTVSVDLEGGFIYAGTGNNYSNSAATDTSDAIVQFKVTGEVAWKNQRNANDVFPGLGPDYDFGANPVLYETMVGDKLTKVVSAGAKSGSAHALNRDTGDELWMRSLGGGSSTGNPGIMSNGAWDGTNMLFACNGGLGATLYALDGATGNIKWMRSLSGAVWGRISVANGVGFAGVGSSLEVFDTATGVTLKNFPSKGGTVAGTITISNGRVAYGEGLDWTGGASGSTLHVLTLKK